MRELDQALFLLVYRPTPNAVWLTIMNVISIVGGGNALFAIVPFVLVKRARTTVLRLLLAIVITAAVVYAVKHTVRRPRPTACVDGVCALGHGKPTDPSFPSGHAAGSSCFVGFFADRRRPWRTLGLASAAFCIGLSRVVLGAHFPIDVTTGFAVGATIGALTARKFAARDAARESHEGAASPAPTDPAQRDPNG